MNDYIPKQLYKDGRSYKQTNGLERTPYAHICANLHRLSVPKWQLEHYAGRSSPLQGGYRPRRWGLGWPDMVRGWKLECEGTKFGP